jgi:hypothetical protein
MGGRALMKKIVSLFWHQEEFSGWHQDSWLQWQATRAFEWAVAALQRYESEKLFATRSPEVNRRIPSAVVKRVLRQS